MPRAERQDGHVYGVYRAGVIDIRDPHGLGRVQVSVPSLRDRIRTPLWAPLATMMAGRERGSWFVPDPGDEVLIAFEAGDIGRPYVVGALWNERARPPAQVDAAGGNATRLLKSRSGLVITFEDRDGAEELAISTPAGQTIRLSKAGRTIEIDDGNGSAIRLDPSGVTIQAAAGVSIRATQVTVSAGHVRFDASAVSCTGTLQADTLIANSVAAATYTPGAGNLL